MGYIPHTPQAPILIFLGDGSEFEVMQTQRVSKDGEMFIRFTMAPFEWVKEMLKINPKELNFDVYIHGTLERQYPKSYILKVSENPEKPMWIAFCDFHGNKMTSTGSEADCIMEILDENRAKQKTIDMKDKEIARLRNEMIALAMKSKEFFETQRSFTEPRSVLPMEMPSGGDVEIKSRTKQSGA